MITAFAGLGSTGAPRTAIGDESANAAIASPTCACPHVARGGPGEGGPPPPTRPLAQKKCPRPPGAPRPGTRSAPLDDIPPRTAMEPPPPSEVVSVSGKTAAPHFTLFGSP